MLRAALFDLDGVVLDTEGQYTGFWKEQGLLYYPDIKDFAQRIKGMTLTQVFEQYFATDTQAQKQIVDALNAFEADMHYKYISGFERFVTGLREQDVLTAVVTSSNLQKMSNVYRSRPELKNYFDAILTSEDFRRSKPDPDCYLEAARRFGLRSDECMGFEDSINGLRALRSAPMFTVALATTNPRDVVSKYADLVIDDFTQMSPEQALELI